MFGVRECDGRRDIQYVNVVPLHKFPEGPEMRTRMRGAMGAVGILGDRNDTHRKPLVIFQAHQPFNGGSIIPEKVNDNVCIQQISHANGGSLRAERESRRAFATTRNIFAPSAEGIVPA